MFRFERQICCDLRTFHGVKFGLKDLLCVKDMTFCNSDAGVHSAAQSFDISILLISTSSSKDINLYIFAQQARSE